MARVLRRTASLLAIALVAAVAPGSQAATTPGFHVSGTQLLDANGQPFVMRAVNHLNATSPDQTMQAMADIKAVGANAVRLTVTGKASADGSQPATSAKDIAAMIAQCKKLKLICVFTDQDTSGYGDAGQTSIPLIQAVNFWASVKSALIGEEAYTLIDIGNMPFGNDHAADWTAAASAAVQKMRAVGFKQTLLVGGPNYGEDSAGVMRANAPKVFAADPLKNTAFSVLMYANYYSPATVKVCIDAYANKKLAMVISEFSWAYLPWGFWNAGSGGADGPDEKSIMAYSQLKGIGWGAYAWSASSEEKAYDDMVVQFNASAHTPWYDTVVSGDNGLKQTSKPASVYK